ncbi:GNAT family N-acetyltransferase [Bauldia sp.]|uniref:GNAT family N-acetyltransferase n=1 Tax=Bauldia sp. TaxID=2575872 RepID=UPI003BA9FC1E
MAYTVRPARFDEYDQLPEIERSAAQRFAAQAMPEIAAGEPTDATFIGAVGALGGVFVAATEPDDVPIGFILVGLLDRAAHIYEISVREEHGRRGLGRQLIDEASRFAGAEGVSALTLATFRHIPWNGPFYQRLGFRYLEQAEWTPALFILRQHEIESGLSVDQRAFMRFDTE